jgi:hypothetical protein
LVSLRELAVAHLLRQALRSGLALHLAVEPVLARQAGLMLDMTHHLMSRLR